MLDHAIRIPARRGRAVRLARGAAIDVINTHGTQVVDFWALCPPDGCEHLSMEHVPWSPDGSLRFEPPVSRPGDLVRFRAAIDLVVVMSACPQDLTPVNGDAQCPVDVHVRLHDPEPSGDE
jgi:uncharacterized protein YcgI (DUF1989 family)